VKAREALGGDTPPIDAAPADLPSGPPALRAHLDRLRDLDGAALREEWRRLVRAEPPRVSRDLMIRAIAYRVQQLEFGGLPKWARHSLAGAGAGSSPAEAAGGTRPNPGAPSPLKPGARLVREWHGRASVVAVLDDAFEFEGRRYRSLTQIACEITGAHWSGPRFFGLTKRRAVSGSGAEPMLPTGAAEVGRLGQMGLGEPNIEARQDAAGAEGLDARDCGGTGVRRRARHPRGSASD
jgi:hypothetical protein